MKKWIAVLSIAALTVMLSSNLFAAFTGCNFVASNDKNNANCMAQNNEMIKKCRQGSYPNQSRADIIECCRQKFLNRIPCSRGTCQKSCGSDKEKEHFFQDGNGERHYYDTAFQCNNAWNLDVTCGS